MRWCHLLVIVLVIHEAHGEVLVIDGPLGRRHMIVPGIESMIQANVSLEAALFAVSVNGWNLGNCAVGVSQLGPLVGWSGGIEWRTAGVPEICAAGFGYELNQNAIDHGSMRYLIFHTDDDIFRGDHDVCENLPFGVISGLMSGNVFQCAVPLWGEYFIIREGDIDANGTVNVTDLLLLLGAWGACAPSCPPDIDSDGGVNVTDLLLLLANWG